MDDSKTITKDRSLNFAKFSGKIETKQLPFYSFMKITIIISVLSAIIMIAFR